ncbi:MAG: penicillin-binding protein activator [Pseudomonadota bacterium]
MYPVPLRPLPGIASPSTHQIARRVAQALALTAAVFLLGCAGGAGTADAPPPDIEAQQLINAGKLKEAATEYLRLAADADPATAGDFRAAAANVFILNNNVPAARQQLKLLEKLKLSQVGTASASLARARLAAAEQRTADALQLLPPQSAIPPTLNRVHVDTRMLAYADGTSPLELARARAELDAYLREPNARRNNLEALWLSVSGLTTPEIEGAKGVAPDAFTGWLQLVEFGRLYAGDAASLQSALDVWRVRFPGHAGNDGFTTRLVERSERLTRPATHVALLLPLSGRFARAGAAVRDGFVAAWLHNNVNPNIQLTIVDTVDKNAVSLFQGVVANGADFVVGPLRKATIAALVAGNAVNVPTLALNAYSPSADRPAPPADLYQLALSPEMEAREVARKIWFDGHHNAVAITPDNDWGQRVSDAFRDAFTNLGGRVLEAANFAATARDMSDPVKQLLNIDNSEQRISSMRRLVRVEMKSEVRRRQDIDAIFMAGFANQARLLRPQLRFHRASGVPVYATSHVYGGVPSPDRDRDIDGVVFGDMPWVVEPSMQGDALIREMNEFWSETMAGFARLFALGADAQALISRVGPLRAQPGTEYAGYTGTLSVRPDNVVERRLTWARFSKGLAELAEAGVPGAAGQPDQ